MYVHKGHVAQTLLLHPLSGLPGLPGLPGALMLGGQTLTQRGTVLPASPLTPSPSPLSFFRAGSGAFPVITKSVPMLSHM